MRMTGLVFYADVSSLAGLSHNGMRLCPSVDFRDVTFANGSAHVFCEVSLHATFSTYTYFFLDVYESLALTKRWQNMPCLSVGLKDFI